MPFEKGQSGNPGGRPKSKPFKEALLMEALAAERGDPCEAKPGSLRWNARKLLEQGEVPSIKELADRLDGKVPQAIVGDDDHDPINHRVEMDAERFTSQLARVIARSGETGGTNGPADRDEG
jgi:hypothetical protein